VTQRFTRQNYAKIGFHHILHIYFTTIFKVCFGALGNKICMSPPFSTCFQNQKRLVTHCMGSAIKNGKIIDTMPVLQRWRGQQQYTDEYTVCRLENS
jgi:hypothetical protein